MKWGAVRLAAIMLALGVTAVPAEGRGGELDALNAAMAGAYGHYRSASFYLRTGNFALAEIELEDMAAKWAAVGARYGAAPPAPFDRDAKWGATLEEVARRVAAGIAAAVAGDRETAREALGPVRGVLADLRRRNGVEVHSDRMNAFDEAVQALWVWRRAPPDFADAAEIARLRSALALAKGRLLRCRDLAPPALRANPGFTGMVAEALDSLRRMGIAVDTADARRLINDLREIYSFNEMMYLRFG